jgi:hypothetical protein
MYETIRNVSFTYLFGNFCFSRINLGKMCVNFFRVADPGCLSRIPDPDFYPSRISDPGSRIQKQQQKRGGKEFVVIPFFVATNFSKLKIILLLKCWRNKMGKFSMNY